MRTIGNVACLAQSASPSNFEKEFMKNFSACLISAVVPCLMAVPLSAQSAELLKARVNVQQEKRDAVVHFSKAAIGQFGVPSGPDANAFIGVTSDFGGTLPVYVLFKDSMPIEQVAKYAERQGRNHGEARCAIVQKGNSPDMPTVPLAVLAQNCVILSVAN